MSDTLVIDIGNTSTSFGLYRGGKVRAVQQVPSSVRKGRKLRKALEGLPASADVRRVVGASVVPKARKRWHKVLREWFEEKPYWVSHKSELGIPISYPEPKTIGPDRLVNAAAAAKRFGCPVVVADFGTALTFDIVTARGGYAGGIIAPGLPLMFSYLADKTALLPHIEPGPVRGMIGKSTEDAMRIGARYGYRGMVREILENLEKRMRVDELTVCATGGYAGWVLRGMDFDVTIDPNLTLKGIGMVGEWNPR